MTSKSLEELVEQYENSWFCRIKEKIKRRVRPVVQGAIIGGLLYCIGSFIVSSKEFEKDFRPETIAEAHEGRKVARNYKLLWAGGLAATLGAGFFCLRRKGKFNRIEETVMHLTANSAINLPAYYAILESPYFESVSNESKIKFLTGYTLLGALSNTIFIDTLKTIKIPPFSNILKYPKVIYNISIRRNRNEEEIRKAGEVLEVGSEIVGFIIASNDPNKNLLQMRKVMDHFRKMNETGRTQMRDFSDTRVFARLCRPLLHIITIPIEPNKIDKAETRIQYYYSTGQYTLGIHEMGELSEEIKNPEKNLMNALYFNGLYRKIKNNPSEMILEGLVKFLKTYPDPEATLNQKWQSALEAVVNDPETHVESLFGDRVVYVASSPFIGGEVCFKRGPKEEHEEEMKVGRQIESLVYTDETRDLSKPLHIFEWDGESYYALSRIYGEDFFTVTGVDAFCEVARFLKDIHRNVRSAKGERNYREKVEEQLRNSPIPEVKDIPDHPHWNMLWTCIRGKPVYDKDPHGLNWYKTEDQTIVIDFGDKGTLPPELQLAKLINESSLMGKHWKEVISAYGGVSEVQYLGATAIMSISYLSSTMEENRGTDEVRKAYLENGITCLQELDLTGLIPSFSSALHALQ